MIVERFNKIKSNIDNQSQQNRKNYCYQQNICNKSHQTSH